jgi:hypothetical protein
MFFILGDLSRVQTNSRVRNFNGSPQAFSVVSGVEQKMNTTIATFVDFDMKETGIAAAVTEIVSVFAVFTVLWGTVAA